MWPSSRPEILETTVAQLQAMGREFIRARGNKSLYFFDYDHHVFELDSEDIDKDLNSSLSTVWAASRPLHEVPARSAQGTRSVVRIIRGHYRLPANPVAHGRV